MGTYNIPRNVKGEGRILFIFSTKSLITSAIGGGIGLFIYFLFNMMGLGIIGVIIAGLFTLIGYSIGMFKVPEGAGFDLAKKTGGENIDDVILRYIKFKKNDKKLYVYTKEEKVNE